MAHEELVCSAGHTFIRESVRGRKPKYCPDHDPRLAEAPAVSRNETYVCTSCGNSWARKAKPGRKPTLCPDCAPAPRVKATGDTETLHCQAGDHDWERARQRGKRPANCPEHRNIAAAVSTARPQLQTLAELRTQYEVDSESARIIQYIENEINRPEWPGWREDEDIRILVRAYNTRVRCIKRNNTPVERPVELEAA